MKIKEYKEVIDKMYAEGAKPREIAEVVPFTAKQISTFYSSYNKTEYPKEISPSDLLKKHGYDPDKYELISASHSSRETIEGENLSTKRVSVRLKKDAIVEDVTDYSKLVENIKPIKLKKSNIKKAKSSLVVNLADLHFGLVNIDYYKDIIEQLLELISSKQWNEIVLVNLGDALHVNNRETRATSSGTVVFGEHNQKAPEYLIQMFVSLIDSANDHSKKIKVVSIIGNHSQFDNIAFLALEQRYRLNKNIEFDIRNDNRTYVQVEKNNVIQYHHGHLSGNAKINRYEKSFYNEALDILNSKSNRFMISGHVHHHQYMDDNGFVKIVAPTATAESDYENRLGFTGAKQQFLCLEMDKDGISKQHHIRK
jgi:hypothetical protein